jgi:bifunctional enzyme CysN/CysC
VGVRQVIVVVNKMDRAGFREDRFAGIEAETRALLASLGLSVPGVVPTVGCDGDNVAERSGRLPWYRGPTLLELLEDCPAPEPDQSAPFRMPVQDVYRFTGRGDDRRIIAGTITSGALRAGDQIAFARSGTTAVVTQFVGWSEAPRESASAGQAVSFTLSPDVAVERGDLACAARGPQPLTRSILTVRLFWTGSTPLSADRDYLLKMGTAREAVRVERFHRVVDIATLEPAGDETRVAKSQIAECTLECARPVSYDAVSALPDTGRFVIVDGHIISGGGLVLEHGLEGGAR